MSKRIVALRVAKDYNYSGWTGLYTVQEQRSNDLCWYNIGAFYDDDLDAEYYAICLGRLGSVPVYDLNGYEIGEYMRSL